MNACLSKTGLMQSLQLLFAVLALSFFSAQHAAHAAKFADKHATNGVENALLELHADPYELTVDSGRTKVRFSVRMTGKAKPVSKIFLRRKGDNKSIAMNDQGKSGDLVARDGIYSVSILLDASRLKPDTCLKYESFTKHGRAKAASSLLNFCVNSFPVRIAASNTDKPVVLPDGTKVVSDEILITTKPNTKPDAVRRLAADINAKVVGSIPQLNLYQLKFSSPASPSRLTELVIKLNARTEVKAASANAIGTYAADPVPLLAEYNSLHGLQLIRAQDIWGAGANGTGVTVVVLDSGLDSTHPDFGTSGDCQLVDGFDCGAASTDSIGHGTQVAGVVAAKSNGSGMVGVAYNSKIHSIQVGGGANPTLPQMAQAFLDAANYIHPTLCTTPTPGTPHPEATVINASFSTITSQGVFVDVTPLCLAINKAVLTESTPGSCVYDGPAAAVVVNAAGNSNDNGYYYPARCNVNEPAATPHAGQNEALTRKDLFITVANSTSVETSDCGAVPVDQRCAAAIPPSDPTILKGSNYGAWVDIAAPGSAIYTTTLVNAGSYTNVTGTSFSAPMVAGAAAILTQCGVPLAQIAPSLRMITNPIGKMNVAFPDATSAPRLDVYLALKTFAPTATNLNAAETYTEDTSLNLTDIVIASDLSVCVTITVTLTLPAAAGSLSSGGINSVAGVWTTTGTVASVNTLLAGLTFAPTANFNSNFNIATSVSDGISTITGSKAMTGIAVNDAPETAAGSGLGAEDAALIAVSLSGSDVDGTVASFRITSLPANGVLYSDAGLTTLIASGGSVSATANAATVYFVPDLNFNGTSNFNYASVDNLGLEDATPATATITVTPVNDPPTILGQPIAFTHIEYNQVNMLSPPFVDDVGTVLTNDPEGDALTFSITAAGNEAVVNGILQSNAFWFDAANPGKLVVNNRLAVNFEFKPVFTLTVRVADASGLFAEATVTVTLTNDAKDNGDPHITTVRGLHYDFQSAGEFVALRGANGMEIQTRQTAIPGPAPFADYYSGLAVGVSINTAVAARVGDHRVTYQPNISGNPASSGLELRVDGVVTTLPANGIDLGSGGRVISSPGGGIQIDFPDGTTMTVSAYPWGSLSYMQINVMHTPAREGIMGLNTGGSWLPRLADGTSFGAMPSALCDRFVELYERFANSWRVTDNTSLFYYAPGTSTSTFTFEWPLEKPPCAAPVAATPTPAPAAVVVPKIRVAPVAPKGIVLKPVAKQVAQRQCRTIVGKNEKANCIFDVMVTGHTGFARAYQRTEKLRAGLTSVIVRDDKDPTQPKESVTFTASVARHAALNGRESAGKSVPTGAVQFTLNGERVGKPVKLDSKGQARWKVSLLKVGIRQVAARYIPAKGSAFLASSSLNESHTVKEKY